jgi:hypothetical protein
MGLQIGDTAVAGRPSIITIVITIEIGGAVATHLWAQ